MIRCAIREALSLAVHHLADLPLPMTLVLDVGVGSPALSRVLLTTSRDVHAAASDRGELALSPREYELLAVALADGRCTRADAAKALAWKAADPARRLTRERLLGPVATPDGGGERWTVRELVGALGAELVGVEVHGG